VLEFVGRHLLELDLLKQATQADLKPPKLGKSERYVSR